MRKDGSSRFWITGLPRSRTAWFAVAMRVAGRSCAHELTAETHSFADLKRQWTEGNSDSACGLQIRRILHEIAPRTLIVERPIDDVLASLSRMFGYDVSDLRPMLERLSNALEYQHPLIKRVRFADLSNRDAVIEAADWLAPGSGAAVAEMMAMNVQVSADHLRALQSLKHSLWHMKEAA